NVELRQETNEAERGPPRPPGAPPPAKPKGPVSRTLRADELYYDVNRHVAVALNASMDVHLPGVPDPVYFNVIEVQQLSPTQFRAMRARFFSSRLPSDPGIDVFMQTADLEDVRIPRRTIFGTPVLNRKTGEPEYEVESLVHGRNVFVDVEGVPVFWSPF